MPTPWPCRARFAAASLPRQGLGWRAYASPQQEGEHFLKPLPNCRQDGEHKLLLNCRLVCGVTRYLGRWRGHTAADDEWLRLEGPAPSPEKVAEYLTRRR